MLKPRFKSITEAVSSFKSLLADMDLSNPKDPTLENTEDSRELEEVTKAVKKIRQLRVAQKELGGHSSDGSKDVQLRKARRIMNDKGDIFSKPEDKISDDLAHIHAKVGSRMPKGRSTDLAIHNQVKGAISNMGKLPEDKEEKRVSLAEAAPMSKYTSDRSALDSFRVLAGLQEREILPWNPGICGTTKHNETIMIESLKFEDEYLGEAVPSAKKQARQVLVPGHQERHREIAGYLKQSKRLNNVHSGRADNLSKLPKKDIHSNLQNMAVEREKMAAKLTDVADKSKAAGNEEHHADLMHHVNHHTKFAADYRKGKSDRPHMMMDSPSETKAQDSAEKHPDVVAARERRGAEVSAHRAEVRAKFDAAEKEREAAIAAGKVKTRAARPGGVTASGNAKGVEDSKSESVNRFERISKLTEGSKPVAELIKKKNAQSVSDNDGEENHTDPAHAAKYMKHMAANADVHTTQNANNMRRGKAVGSPRPLPFRPGRLKVPKNKPEYGNDSSELSGAPASGLPESVNRFERISNLAENKITIKLKAAVRKVLSGKPTPPPINRPSTIPTVKLSSHPQESGDAETISQSARNAKKSRKQ